MFNPFSIIKKITVWFRDKLSPKGKIIAALSLLFVFIGIGFMGYKVNEYGETNPNACLMCHVHDNAQVAWAASAHKNINCHECHHASKSQQLTQMFRFAFMGQRSVPPRHGEIIVTWKLCIKCHWETDSRYPNAPRVNHSPYHGKHVFLEQIECSKCHGYKTHEFRPEPRFCVNCHKDREVHGEGMDSLPCLNCHTDRTKDLKPGRNKCLFCHGTDAARKALEGGSTIDTKYFTPSQATIKKATKINVPADAPMQFYCYECHKPHAKIRPDWGDCLTRCHSNQMKVGKHMMHVQGMNMKCLDCHRPHSWRVTEQQAKTTCVKCHEYRSPDKFITY
jgi:cytochrome c nitrite reductase small subunit